MKNEISPHYLIHFLSNTIMHRMNQATLFFKRFFSLKVRHIALISSLNQKGDTLNVS